jgi:hypothetical protein
MASEVANGGNTVVPAILVLDALGYRVKIKEDLVARTAPRSIA